MAGRYYNAFNAISNSNSKSISQEVETTCVFSIYILIQDLTYLDKNECLSW